MATLTITNPTLDSPDTAMVAADAGGDEFPGTNQSVLLVHNGDGSAKTVTIVSQVTDTPGVTGADIAESVPAGETWAFRLGNLIDRFLDADGLVQVTYSAVTNVEVAVIEF